MNDICPFCEDGKLGILSHSDLCSIGNRASILVTDLLFCVCDMCGTECVPDDIHDYNLNLIKAASYEKY
jgi:hypothetical protein